MKIPAEIDPCPISEAIMEVRFESNFSEAPIFGMIFSQIKEKFSETEPLPILEVPIHVRNQDPNLKFLPLYRIYSKETKNFIIQIGPNVFSVIVTNEYSGWKSFKELIDFGLKALENSGVVKKITRLGLRYINFFHGNILHKSNLNISLSNDDLADFHSNIRLEIPEGLFLNKLSINVPAFKKDKDNLIKGSVIDIDTIREGDMPDFFSEKDAILEEIHNIEKKLFSRLLSEEYVKSLKKITYA